MMDVVSKINEILELIYTIMSKEIFIVILAGILFLLYETLKDKGNKNAK